MNYKKENILNANEQYIVHQVNDLGVMGAGLALQIKNRYPKVFNEYRKEYNNLNLGDIQCVSVSTEQAFVNMFSQRGISRYYKTTDYTAMEKCFKKLKEITQENKSIAIPFKIGCGLAGGDWNIVEKLIETYLPYATIYKL